MMCTAIEPERPDVLLAEDQEIADSLGATREAVNRALSRLRDVGAIRSVEGRIEVTDLTRLRRYAAG